MRCVSKPWNTLLSHPSFVKFHLDHRSIRRMNDTINDDEILLVFKDGYFDPCHPFLTHPSRSSVIQLPNLGKLPNSKPSCGSSIFIGSVNGLICFADYHAIHIWNPSLTALTPLPSYTTTTGNDMLFRFGFDPLNDDYKVVKISLSLDEHLNIVQGSLEVEVYSLRKGFWELVTGFPSHVSMICNNDEVCVDGHAYWLCYVDALWMRQTIVAFNLTHETFREISLPNSMEDYTGSTNRLNVLGVLSQKLCVISCIYNGDCEVWLLMDDKWVKHHVLPPFDGEIMPIGFTPNSLFLFGIGRHLALYDPDAAAVKLFSGIINTPDSFTKVVPYVDSLIWPPTLRAIN